MKTPVTAASSPSTSSAQVPLALVGMRGDFRDPKEPFPVPNRLKNADNIVDTEEVVVCMFAL